MFRIFQSFRIPSRVWGWPKCRKFQSKCTREVLDINEVTYEKLVEKVKEGAILIDVRTKQEFLEKHLDAAILIPYYEINKKIQNMVPNKDDIIILYCQNGGRSLKAYKILEKLGYSNIYNLKGGMEEIN